MRVQNDGDRFLNSLIQEKNYLSNAIYLVILFIKLINNSLFIYKLFIEHPYKHL